MEQPAEDKAVMLCPANELALEDFLDAIEHAPLHDRLMSSDKKAEPGGTDYSGIEDVVKHRVDLRESKWVAILVPQPNRDPFFGQLPQGICASGVELEEPSHNWAPCRVNLFRLAGTAVDVSDRGVVRQNALLQATVNALQSLFSKVPDVVHG